MTPKEPRADPSSLNHCIWSKPLRHVSWIRGCVGLMGKACFGHMLETYQPKRHPSTPLLSINPPLKQRLSGILEVENVTQTIPKWSHFKEDVRIQATSKKKGENTYPLVQGGDKGWFLDIFVIKSSHFLFRKQSTYTGSSEHCFFAQMFPIHSLHLVVRIYHVRET